MIDALNPPPLDQEITDLAQKIPKHSKKDLDWLIRIIDNGKILNPREVRVETTMSHLPVIEVAGQPKSMKTTIIDSTIEYLTSVGISARKVAEPTINFDKRLFPIEYTLAFVTKTIEGLLQTPKERNEIIFLDRGVYDRIAFLKAQKENGLIDFAQYELVKGYLLSFFGKFVDSLIVCNCSPEASLMREGPRKEPGPIMEPVFLSHLSSEYSTLPNSICFPSNIGRGFVPRVKFLPFASIDTTNINESMGNLNWRDTISRSFTHNTAEVKTWHEYQKVFIKTVGSFCQFFTLKENSLKNNLT